MFAAATVALLISLALALARAVLGPTVFDRVQAANTVGTLAMLLVLVVEFLGARPDLLDVALVYGLLNILGTFAVLKFFRHGDLGYSADETEERT